MTIALWIIRRRLAVLDVAMVKYFPDIFVDKRSAIVSNNLVRDAKSTDYVLSDEIYNS